MQSIIQSLREHRMRLPEKFGSYQLVELNVKPPVKPYVIFLFSYVHGFSTSCRLSPLDPDSCAVKQEYYICVIINMWSSESFIKPLLEANSIILDKRNLDCSHKYKMLERNVNDTRSFRIVS